MATLEVSHNDLTIKIGKNDLDRVNLFTNFNPIDNDLFISHLKKSPCIKSIFNIANYENGTGGLGIRLNPEIDIFSLRMDLDFIIKEISK